jgi:hypothetical protein
MLRDAEGTLNFWNAGGMQGGRRSKDGTKTLASLYEIAILPFEKLKK